MSLVEHCSHDHPLILKEEHQLDAHDIKIVCHGCRNPINSGTVAAYTCCTDQSPFYPLDCEHFYLHKTCAELPNQITNHPGHTQHPLTLLPHPPYDATCDVCKCQWKWFTYHCASCNFDVCVVCAFEERQFYHQGHRHMLTLTQRQALFTCDACHTEDKDFSYACNTCHFWIHKSCANSPQVVQLSFHPHPLQLIYSVPEMYRTFNQYCEICHKVVSKNYWLYCCEMCRYLVHLKCATSRDKLSLKEKEIAEGESHGDEYGDLAQLPVSRMEALMDIMMDQFGKMAILENDLSNSTTNGVIIKHPAHENHPLVLVQNLVVEDLFRSLVTHTKIKGNEMLLVCNGCTLPVSVAHPFYICLPCNFFLHKFCAKLPLKLPAGKCPSHPQHSLQLFQRNSFFGTVTCSMCLCLTNGFVYECLIKTCNFVVDIRCCFAPNKLKHKSHMHPLALQSDVIGHDSSGCSACHCNAQDLRIFKCGTCDDFGMDLWCALLPSSIMHKWDPHPIPLICGDLCYEGVMYCEICEEEVNPKGWLYHCGECDHSFHATCVCPLHNVKFGGTLVVDAHQHALTLVSKLMVPGWHFHCDGCGKDCREFPDFICFECARCDYLLCRTCATKPKKGEHGSRTLPFGRKINGTERYFLCKRPQLRRVPRI